MILSISTMPRTRARGIRRSNRGRKRSAADAALDMDHSSWETRSQRLAIHSLCDGASTSTSVNVSRTLQSTSDGVQHVPVITSGSVIPPSSVSQSLPSSSEGVQQIPVITSGSVILPPPQLSAGSSGVLNCPASLPSMSTSDLHSTSGLPPTSGYFPTSASAPIIIASAFSYS